MAERSPTNEVGFIASLRLRDYRMLWSSSMLSASGQWTLLVGRGWLVHELTHSSTWVGLVTFAAMVPYLVATPIGGVLADRMDRRRLAALMQGVSLIASALLALLVYAGVVQAWEVLALALLAGVGRAAETPATTAIIPNVVPPSYLLNAISLNSVATFGSRLIGPAIGAVLLDVWGAGSVFTMTAIFYLFAILMINRVGLLDTSKRAPVVGGFVRQNIDTWKYVAAAPMMAVIFIVVGLHCALTMSIDSVLPQFADHTLHGSSGTYGLMVMAFGAGTMAGTFSLGSLQSGATKGRLLVATGLLSGVTTAWLALTQSPLLAFFAMASMGASQAMFMALASTLVQEVVPDHLRGRVTAAYLMGTGGVMSISNLLSGTLADQFGVPAVLLLPALVFVAALLLLTGAIPGLRRLFRSGTLPIDVAASPA
jgi:MFS family permease